MLEIEHAVAPAAFESTALLKSLCCCAWKVATENFSRETEKVTARQLELRCGFLSGSVQYKQQSDLLTCYHSWC